MRNNLLQKIFFIGFLFIGVYARAQQDRLAYVVTDSIKNGSKWNYLRTVDTRDGDYSRILCMISSDAVAAIAYDKKNRRLYYTPMLADKLAYIDLRTMRTHIVSNNFTGLMPKESDQSNIITRMVIADDDKGYALTNDGRHLIRFRTSNNPAIKDLGSLIDASGNNEVSIHNGCASFGGDLVADDDGKLYLFTFARNVFKINIDTRIAKYIGKVNGLPATFSISGAAVDKSCEKIIIVSNTDSSDAYSLDFRSLFARRLRSDNPGLSSDLASASILKTRERDGHHYDDKIMINEENEEEKEKEKEKESVRIYPNPVTTREFKINFVDAGSGAYTVTVIDINGKTVISKIVTVGGKNNIVAINLPEQVSSGIYVVRIAGRDNNVVYSNKIIVQ